MGTLKTSPILFICVLLFLSILIRWPAFTNPVRGSHGWLTAHTVVTTQIWASEGISTYNFSPVYTFPNQADKDLRTLASGLADKEGNFYYVSYPPLSFYVSYLFFSLLFLKPSLTGLYLLNIIIHLFSSILLYILVCKVHQRDYTKGIFTPGIVASSLYIFSAQNLWSHVYIFFADSLVQVLWAFYILLAFLLFKQGGVRRQGLLLVFFLSNLLLVYTEWLGLFGSFILFLYSLFKAYEEPIYIRVSIIIVLATILSLGITIIQYSLIDGLQSFLDTSVNKYSTRNGYASDGFYYAKLRINRLLLHYWKFYQANLILLIGFLLLLLISVKRTFKFIRDQGFILAIVISPILIHHAVFLEFSSMHDFSTLKTSIPFCLTIAFIFSSIDFEQDQRITSTNKEKIGLFFLVIMILLNIAFYYKGETFRAPLIFSSNANFINLTVEPEETIFAISEQDRENGLMVYMGNERAFSPQIQLLTQRNILAISSRATLVSHMNDHNKQKGKAYLYDKYGKLIGIESYNTH